MPTVEYMHVCDYAFPTEGGKQCIIGIFDVIHAASFPVVHPMMALALRLRGTAHEVLALKVELGRPNGEVLGTIQGDITLAADGSMFIQMQFANVSFPEPGRYTFKVSSAGQPLTTHSIQLQKMQTPLQSAPTGSAPKQFH